MARPSLFTHRKFVRLSRTLGAPYRAVGVLEAIWHHAYQDGDPCLGAVEDVEYMIGWDGEPGACVEALVDVGFLDVVDDELHVHDLDDHAPDYVRKRRRREADRRSRSANVGRCPDTDQSLTRQRRPNGSTPAPAPAPAPNGDVMSDTARAESDHSTPAEPGVVLRFPTKRSDESEYELTESKLSEYQDTYPHLDVVPEVRKARQWLIDNPARQKTLRGTPAFLTRWLNRVEGSKGQATPAAKSAEFDRSADANLERAIAAKKGASQ